MRRSRTGPFNTTSGGGSRARRQPRSRLPRAGQGRGTGPRVPEIRAGGAGPSPTPARRDPAGDRHQHLWFRPAHGARPHHRTARPDAGPRDHRRGRRGGPRRRVHQAGRRRQCAVQHRLGPMSQLQGGQHRRLRERQPGQARYVTVPYADWNLLKFPGRDQAMAKIRDLAMLSDIFPTGYHGAYTAGVGTGSTVYVAGAGPVGLACATSCQLLGAAVTIVGDMNPRRLQQAASFGCETIDLSQHDNLPEQVEQILGTPEVDAAVDCVGFEARGHGADGSQQEQPATVLNSLMTLTRSAGKLGIPGLYVTGDPGAATEDAKVGTLGIRIGLGWAKSQSFTTGQCPVMRYNRQLMMAILNDKVQIARNVNATVIPLDQAPQGYEDFDKGAAKKYVLDPNQMISAA